jgi:hypothetical protein
MAALPDPGSEHTFPSTTFVWKQVKMKPPPAGHTTARAKRGRFGSLPTWPRHRDLTITIRHRGGAESWWLIQSRGRHAAFPGHLSIEDVMVVVLSEAWPSERP